MTYQSGPCLPPPSGGRQHVSSRFYPEPIVITDDEIRADEADREADEPQRPSAEQQPERES